MVTTMPPNSTDAGAGLLKGTSNRLYLEKHMISYQSLYREKLFYCEDSPEVTKEYIRVKKDALLCFKKLTRA